MHRIAEARFIQAVRERPPHEAPLEALRQAVLEGWPTIHEAVESVVPAELQMRMYHLIESTPMLLAAHMRRSAETEEAVARLIAEREGVDVDGDLRPRVVVALFSGLMRLTERRWGAGSDMSVAAMRDLTATYLDAMGPALAGNWRTE